MLNEGIKVLLAEAVARSRLAAPHVDETQRAIGDEGHNLFVGDVEMRRRLIERQQFGFDVAGLALARRRRLRIQRPPYRRRVRVRQPGRLARTQFAGQPVEHLLDVCRYLIGGHRRTRLMQYADRVCTASCSACSNGRYRAS